MTPHYLTSHSLEEVLNHLSDSSALLVLDLDNTLIECATSYGSYQWAAYQIKQALKQGQSFKSVLDHYVPLWEDLQFHTQIKLIEEKTPLILSNLQDQGMKVIALTGRSPKLKEVTAKKLKEQGVVFSNPLKDTLSFDSSSDYHEGILFAGPHNSKGSILTQFIQCASQTFSKVIFFDDQKNYIEDVGQSMSELGLPFEGHHYVGLQEKVKNFDIKVAEKEKEKLFSSLQMPVN